MYMKVLEAKYIKNDEGKICNIVAKVEGYDHDLGVPIDPDNMHYEEIKRQEDAGELTIEAADE